MNLLDRFSLAGLTKMSTNQFLFHYFFLVNMTLKYRRGMFWQLEVKLKPVILSDFR